MKPATSAASPLILPLPKLKTTSETRPQFYDIALNVGAFFLGFGIVIRTVGSIEHIRIWVAFNFIWQLWRQKERIKVGGLVGGVWVGV